MQDLNFIIEDIDINEGPEGTNCTITGTQAGRPLVILTDKATAEMLAVEGTYTIDFLPAPPAPQAQIPPSASDVAGA